MIEVLIPISIALFSFYFGWWRNHLVWSYRDKVMDDIGLSEFYKLPHYYKMVFNPIEWSDARLKRFIKGGKYEK